jgi:Asp/Glu/hydantoin racemase
VLAPPGTTSVQVNDRATEVVVVVPAFATPVEALTGAVDDRRADAAETAATLARQLPNARAEIGAADPLLAIADALRAFGADEIVIVGGDDALLEQAREKFAVPIKRG